MDRDRSLAIGLQTDMRTPALVALPILLCLGTAAVAQQDGPEERVKVLEERLKTLEERYAVTVKSLYSTTLQATFDQEALRKLRAEVDRQSATLAELEGRLRKIEPASSTPAAAVGAAAGSSIEAVERAAFARYPAATIYRGAPRLPDFQGRDRDYANYRTRLRNGMGEGANFAGALAMVEIGCGTSCRFAFAGDVRNGQVFSFPIGGEDYYSLDLRYQLESRAVVAYWQANQRCVRDIFVWNGKEFVASGQTDIGSAETCYRRQ